MYTSIILLFMAVIIDVSIILSGRSLLLDFLHGATSDREYRDIHESQTREKKLSLSYILNYIRYEPDVVVFKKYRLLYMIGSIYAMAIFVLSVCLLFLCQKELFLYLLLILAVPKVVILVILERPRMKYGFSIYVKKPEDRWGGKTEDKKEDKK